MALSEFLLPIENLHFQALNKFMYQSGICRVQQRWILTRSVHFFTSPFGNHFAQSVIRYDHGKHRGLVQLITRDLYNFEQQTTVFV